MRLNKQALQNQKKEICFDSTKQIFRVLAIMVAIGGILWFATDAYIYQEDALF